MRDLGEDLLPVVEALTIHNGELSSDVKWIQFIRLKIKIYAKTLKIYSKTLKIKIYSKTLTCCRQL